MFPLAVDLGEDMDLGAVAAELAAERPLDFGELIEVADLAVEHEQWEVGAEYAEAALEKATPAAFLADYPDDDYTPEEAVIKADRRKVMSYADLGWALWNLGDEAKAMVIFETAAPLKTVDYLGIADTTLDLFWGRASLAAGNPEQAMKLLAPNAVMGSDREALETLREAYIAVNTSDEGFDGYLWSERQRLARSVDDFTLADYQGTDHDFSALSDGKVTLLAFWFPT
jgi:tetratricopeptide (TPR) repeat protein